MPRREGMGRRGKAWGGGDLRQGSRGRRGRGGGTGENMEGLGGRG